MEVCSRQWEQQVQDPEVGEAFQLLEMSGGQGGWSEVSKGNGQGFSPGARSCRLLKAMVRTLDFILSEVESLCGVLNRDMKCSD